ncbi:MAG: nucleoside-diphosphate kinase [candidate division Zixibacteria bacterium]|nr:nucleoside-diphosphate kinase [candidate division Zixibacteria bacterium]
MILSKTLLIVKPDATDRRLIGHIISRLERAQFRIVAMCMLRMDGERARRFYAVHEGKPFLDDLVAFMSSGSVVPMVLEKHNAVEDLRILVGATDPEKAACGTIRQEIGVDVQRNSVHASDSDENAAIEIAFFFND